MGAPPLANRALPSKSARFVGPFWGGVQEARRDRKVLGRNAAGANEWVPLAPASVPSSCPTPTPCPMPPECLAVTLRMVVLLSSHKLIMGPELRMSEVSLPSTLPPPPVHPPSQERLMACPGVQRGWSQALTWAVGCWPVISSPRGRKKKGCCFLLLSLCPLGEPSLQSCHSWLTLTSVGPLA